jgi:hypothetical protein
MPQGAVAPGDQLFLLLDGQGDAFLLLRHRRLACLHGVHFSDAQRMPRV